MTIQVEERYASLSLELMADDTVVLLDYQSFFCVLLPTNVARLHFETTSITLLTTHIMNIF